MMSIISIKIWNKPIEGKHIRIHDFRKSIYNVFLGKSKLVDKSFTFVKSAYTKIYMNLENSSDRKEQILP